MPEEEEKVTETWVPVWDRDITPSSNPKAEGWYETEEGADSWAIPVPSQDESPVPGKIYYYYIYNDQEGENRMSDAIAYSTYQTYLMYRSTTNGTYSKVVDIKDYPDLLGDVNLLDCTSLSDGQEKKIPGITRLGDGMQFTANYTPSNFNTVKGLEGHQYDYAVWLGGTTAGVPDGHNGKFSWTGDVRAGFPGKGVDEVADMTITATPSTDVAWSSGT